MRVKKSDIPVPTPEAAPKRASWWSFIIVAVVFVLATLFFLMVLHVLPTPTPLVPLVTAVRTGLGEFELTIMRRFMSPSAS